MAFKNNDGDAITPDVIAQDMQRVGVNFTEIVAKNSQEAEQKSDNDVPQEESSAQSDAAPEPEREFTEAEHYAMTQGWNPKGEKSAEEFMVAKPYWKEIRQRGKTIKELQATVEQLKKMITSDKEQNNQRTLDQLRAQKREAIKLGDVDLVDLIEAQEKNILAPPIVDEPVEYSEAIEDFKERHADWLSDYGYEAMQMKEFVLERDRQLGSLKLKPERHIEIIEKDLRKRFPDHFKEKEPASRSARSSVESDISRSSVNNKRKPTFHDLSQDQKKIARYMEKHAKMPIEKYIDKLIEVGGISY